MILGLTQCCSLGCEGLEGRWHIQGVVVVVGLRGNLYAACDMVFVSLVPWGCILLLLAGCCLLLLPGT